MRRAYLAVFTVFMIFLMLASAVYAHVSRDTEDAKYRVTLGVRPEPAITEKDVVLEAKIVRKADNSPVSGLKNISFTIVLEGKKVAELSGGESRERGLGGTIAI
ncbi:MAG: hypothetical protein QXQ57_01510 [Sulfolobales archaeon]